MTNDSCPGAAPPFPIPDGDRVDDPCNGRTTGSCKSSSNKSSSNKSNKSGSCKSSKTECQEAIDTTVIVIPDLNGGEVIDETTTTGGNDGVYNPATDPLSPSYFPERDPTSIHYNPILDPLSPNYIPS